jgi:hypothetical protein
VAAGPLAECVSFEQVDAQVAEASRIELLTHDLQIRLGREERVEVLAALALENVKEINGVPLAEASDRQIGDFLSAAYKGTRLTQNQAQPRKQYLANEDRAVTEAAKLIPGLKDAASAEFKQFKSIVDANAWVRHAGPNWPVVIAQFMLGAAAATKINAPGAPVKAAVIPPKIEIVPAVPTRKTPGAPRASGAAIPATTEYEAARGRVQKGTATLADVQLMAKHGLTTDANAPAAMA